MNQLILGDNLEILKSLPSNYVDLIYLDPPFCSNRIYSCESKLTKEKNSYSDIFIGGSK